MKRTGHHQGRFFIGRTGCVFAIAAAVLAVTQTGCTTNPATGRSQLNFLKPDQEIALGAEAMPQLVEEYGGVVPDAQLRSYVEQVGMEMMQYTEGDSPDLPWEFTLLDSEVINAFALPGGKVFMSEGLMTMMSNEAQLAGVLGHEIGHVTARHINDRMAQAAGVSILGAIATQVTKDSDYSQLTGVLVGVGGQGYLLKFSRDQELESDRLGMRYMSRAGYDPAGQLQVMQILNEAAQASSSLPPEFLSTHPHPESRIEQVEKLLKTKYASTQNSPEYQMFEERFQRIARPRLDALDRRRDSGQVGSLRAIQDVNAFLAASELWCGTCRAEAHLANQ
ncbi:MAG: M48 family metalloprotease [Planctomycetes bacterium]|nr:M48 family metalloprotease [Planctomycetota bacterium]